MCLFVVTQTPTHTVQHLTADDHFYAFRGDLALKRLARKPSLEVAPTTLATFSSCDRER